MDQAELERLKARLESGDESLSSIAEAASTAPAWARQLVGAAQRRVTELESALQSTREDVSRLRDSAESLIKENEQLRVRLSEILERQHASGGDSAGFFGLSTGVSSSSGTAAVSTSREETVKELGERVELLLTENALMVEESSAVQAELERVKVELKGREEEVGSLVAQTETARTRSAELERGAREHKEAARAVERRYVEQGAELASAKGQISELKEGLSTLQHENDTLREELEEKGKTIAELAQRSEAEGDELWQKVQEAALRARELQEALAAKSREADAVSERARREARELETVRNDNAGMLRVMSGMEKQLAAYAAREESVAAVARDSKEKAENALLERDKASAREAHLARELEAERAQRGLEVQRLLEECEQAVATERERSAAKLRERDLELKAAVERAATASAKADRRERQAEQAAKAERHVRAEFEQLESRLVSEVVTQHERKRLDAELRARDLHKQLDATRRSPGTPLDEPSATLRQLQQRVEELEEELRIVTADGAAATDKLRDATETCHARERELARLNKALVDERAEAAKTLTTAVRHAEADRDRLERSLRAATKANDDAAAALAQQNDRHTTHLAKLAAERDETIRRADARLADEEAVVAKLSDYDRDLEIRLAAALADLLAEKQRAAKLDDAAKIAQKRAADLSTQLAKSLREQQHLLVRSNLPFQRQFPSNIFPTHEPSTEQRAA